jgi:phosphoribosylanthranilate isomerase
VVKVKICGLRSREDARAALEMGADAVGFVLEPSSPRYIVPAAASEIASDLGVGVASVAVYGPTPFVDPPEGFQFIQATAWPDEAGKENQIQAMRLMPEDTLKSALARVRPGALLLLDSYHESGFGGHGLAVDWSLARSIRDFHSAPIALAGGLTPENVAAAIDAVRPKWVDVSSGVEAAPGVKDYAKMAAFIRAAKAA